MSVQAALRRFPTLTPGTPVQVATVRRNPNTILYSCSAVIFVIGILLLVGANQVAARVSAEQPDAMRTNLTVAGGAMIAIALIGGSTLMALSRG